jgi:hypothetical protein
MWGGAALRAAEQRERSKEVGNTGQKSSSWRLQLTDGDIIPEKGATETEGEEGG